MTVDGTPGGVVTRLGSDVEGAGTLAIGRGAFSNPGWSKRSAAVSSYIYDNDNALRYAD